MYDIKCSAHHVVKDACYYDLCVVLVSDEDVTRQQDMR